MHLMSNLAMDDFQKAKVLKGELTANREGYFIMSEVERGLSFIDLAVTTTNAQTKERNLSDAQLVHVFAVILLQTNTSLTDAQRSGVEASLAHLKTKIDRLHKNHKE
jgi:hypothetical protein